MIESPNKMSSSINTSIPSTEASKVIKTDSEKHKEKDIELQKSFQRMPLENQTSTHDHMDQNFMRNRGTRYQGDKNISPSERSLKLVNTMSPIALIKNYPKASIAAAFGLGILASRSRKSMLGSTVLLSAVTLGMEYLSSKLSSNDTWQRNSSDSEGNRHQSNPLHPEENEHQSKMNRVASNVNSEGSFVAH